jgi:CheY-like chemotaxis protein
MPEPEKTYLKKVIIAHERSEILEGLKGILSGSEYNILTASDGVGVMLTAVREMPDVAVLDIALPKINGYEVSKRLKARPEVKGLKTLLISSTTDERRQRKTPDAMFGIDAYIDEEDLASGILEAIDSVIKVVEEAPPFPPERPEPAAPTPTVREQEDADVERAKRLARTVFADIELYNPEKTMESIKEGTFQSVFASDLKEGLRHYRKRVSEEIRGKGDFFKDALADFVEKKRREQGL